MGSFQLIHALKHVKHVKHFPDFVDSHLIGRACFSFPKIKKVKKIIYLIENYISDFVVNQTVGRAPTVHLLSSSPWSVSYPAR